MYSCHVFFFEILHSRTKLLLSHENFVLNSGVDNNKSALEFSLSEQKSSPPEKCSNVASYPLLHVFWTLLHATPATSACSKNVAIATLLHYYTALFGTLLSVKPWLIVWSVNKFFRIFHFSFNRFVFNSKDENLFTIKRFKDNVYLWPCRTKKP